MEEGLGSLGEEKLSRCKRPGGHRHALTAGRIGTSARWLVGNASPSTSCAGQPFRMPLGIALSSSTAFICGGLANHAAAAGDAEDGQWTGMV